MNESLGKQIHDAALKLGFDNCGIIPVGTLEGFEPLLQTRIHNVPESAAFYKGQSRYSKVKEDYPWAKSVVVCVRDLGKYRLPEEIRSYYAHTLFKATSIAAGIPQKKKRLEQFFEDLGIRHENEARKGSASFTSARFAAEKAGLGIVRRNNAFYTEKGSYISIAMWLIDQECEYIADCHLKPCPDDCNRCVGACPTQSLTAPFTMNPGRCVSYLTTLGTGELPDDITESAVAAYLWGCDECQKACPFHQGTGDMAQVEVKNTEAFTPKAISCATDEELAQTVGSELLRMKADRLDLIRKNANRLLRAK